MKQPQFLQESYEIIVYTKHHSLIQNNIPYTIKIYFGKKKK